MDVERYRTLLLAIMAGVSYEAVDLRGKSITERNEFTALEREFAKELRPMRVHQVSCGGPLVVFYFQWCLAFSDRWTDKATCYKQFYDYALKNNYIESFRMDKEYLARLKLFNTIHDLVLEYRRLKAA
ncbi:hypothetical protein D3C85_90190 [compost metagenome]